MSAVATAQTKLTQIRAPDTGKIVTAEEAVRLIRDGDTVATGGFVGIGFAEEIAVALEAQYLSKDIPASEKPRNLTLVYAAGQGDGKERGLNHLGHAGGQVPSRQPGNGKLPAIEDAPGSYVKVRAAIAA